MTVQASIRANRPKYLLLFGDASFDYKDRITNNTNFVPAYQSNNSSGSAYHLYIVMISLVF